jgi:hypothetical protein
MVCALVTMVESLRVSRSTFPSTVSLVMGLENLTEIEINPACPNLSTRLSRFSQSLFFDAFLSASV